jgi:hypothetical protein
MKLLFSHSSVTQEILPHCFFDMAAYDPSQYSSTLAVFTFIREYAHKIQL